MVRFGRFAALIGDHGHGHRIFITGSRSMTHGTFYELARARRAMALQALALRQTGMGLLAGRNRPVRLTVAAAHRLMQRDA